MTDKAGKVKENEHLETEDNNNTNEAKADDSARNEKSKKSASKSKTAAKTKELEDKISALEEENKQLKDQALRKMAEFENYKRRTEREFLSLLENANEVLIGELLPVIDDLERFLAHSGNAQDNDSLQKGVELIYKKLMNTLQKKGLKPMQAVGQEFDAEQHQALMQVDSDKYDSGYVLEEHLKGYLLNDKVIRHAQVLVTK